MKPFLRMNRINKKSPQKSAGFTFLELVIVVVIVGIVAAIGVPVFNSLLDASRIRITYNNMAEIERAIIGDPSTNFLGFRHVMRRNPNPLSELWTTAASAFNPFTGTGAGGTTFLDPGANSDGWTNPFLWNAGTSELQSLGADNAVGGTGADADITKVIGAGGD